MALKVPNAAELELLNLFRTQLNGAVLFVKLFRNNYTPVDTSVIGDFTEATFSGYAGISVTDFAAATTIAGRAVTISAAAKSWTKNGAVGNDIYGYYIANAAGTILYWAERGSGAPYSMQTNGEGLSVTPQLSFATEF